MQGEVVQGNIMQDRQVQASTNQEHLMTRLSFNRAISASDAGNLVTTSRTVQRIPTKPMTPTRVRASRKSNFGQETSGLTLKSS